MKQVWKLFEVFGQELEYMIVDRDSLEIRPIADKLLVDKKGKVRNDTRHGKISWSNELAMHILEFKLTKPTANISGNEKYFHKNIVLVNKILEPYNAMLLPTAMHPLFIPGKQAKLWSYGHTEIYKAYDRIFNCLGHGWLNVQSAHLNISFGNEEEFTRLHSAIRFALPLIPALAASSPVVEKKHGNSHDNRLIYYAKNQSRIKEISGSVIPEIIESTKTYRENILQPMYAAIAPFDDSGILQEEWLNSRGAIARFDRSAIEIRIIDTQECPFADEAVAVMVSQWLQELVQKSTNIFRKIKNFPQENLVNIYNDCIKNSGSALVKDTEYLQVLGIKSSMPAQIIWVELFNRLLSKDMKKSYAEFISVYSSEGSLASRIISTLGKNPGTGNIIKLYKILGKCLLQNRVYSDNEI